MQTAYINGHYLPASEATISPLDRGFVFGEGVYEVIPAYHGKIFHLGPHIARLNESLKGMRMSPPLSESGWREILENVLKKNGGGDQWIYIQVTRGMQPERSHKIPAGLTPTIFVISYHKPRVSKAEKAKGLKVTTVTDIRWKHCNVKTTARLAYVLMHQEAIDAGFEEGIIVNNSTVLEGTISNVFVVRHGVIMTPPKSHQILSGITRERILALAETNNIPYRETKILERDLLKADELWITNSTRGVAPVVEFNGQAVGNGLAGPLWEKMWTLYEAEIDQHCQS